MDMSRAQSRADSNAPSAIAMSHDTFLQWSGEVAEMVKQRQEIGHARTNKLTGSVFNWSARNSLYPLHFGIACCAIEMAAAAAPRFDIERLGVIFWNSPRQCDVLLLNGWISMKLKPVLIRLYEQMPYPKWVICMGECTISGGPWWDSYNIVRGADTFLPVDIYIPGCPPRPEALLDGFLKLQKKIRSEKENFMLPH
ncbi:MAG: NADH-quinone oxidoreductase subunit NuoB [Candidatus Thermoplasmatota archaeon]|jgi:NADH-quinone oxidoreductase subunit B|nr:NADH-quinone oxidoreductase subunit NuoB [Candidatus Thermoplasmatota archaeon]MCL5253301.1 NADH-quinone oxidoreductase subunit NuoB [Candidatus Thermoplasmatota archaeon]